MHDRKSGGDITQSGRGSNSLGGKASILLSIRRLGDSHPSTYRAIEVLGRHGEFKWHVELTDADYVFVGDAGATKKAQTTKQLHDALPRLATDALTLDQLLEKTQSERTTLSERSTVV